MSTRIVLFLALLLPVFASGQSPATAWPAPNALTMQVLMAQRPAHIPEVQWQAMVLQPTHAGLYPIRITQALLDTIDATQLDRRYQCIMVRDEPRPPVQPKQ